MAFFTLPVCVRPRKILTKNERSQNRDGKNKLHYEHSARKTDLEEVLEIRSFGFSCLVSPLSNVQGRAGPIFNQSRTQVTYS